MGNRRQDVYGEFDRDTGALVGLLAHGGASLPLTALGSLTGAAFSGMTYDGSGRLTGYLRNGVAHIVTWSDATHATVSNATGAPARAITLDASGRVVSIL